MNEESNKLARARIIALRYVPYLSSMIYGMIPIPVPGCGTFFVTPGLVMGYDPEFLRTLSDEECAGVYAHEANHPLRDTHARLACLEGDDAELKNIAADIPINDDLDATAIPLPGFACRAKDYGLPAGLTTEQYYALLRANPPPPKKRPGKVCAGKCGTGGGNGNKELEEKLDAEYGRTPADVHAKRMRTVEAINKRSRGHIGGDLLEIIKLCGCAKVPWRRTLEHVARRYVSSITMGSKDYSMRRPSTRMFTRDDSIIQPDLISWTPEIAVCIDTSASMRTKDLERCIRETAGVLTAIPGVASVLFLEADTSVVKVSRIKLSSLQNIELHGRGGTDFRPTFEYVRRMRKPPDLLIYFTDGEGVFPQAPPRKTKVIWGVVPAPYRTDLTPPWGTTIKMED
jgi:predicted metal-dependent peptidase